MNILIQSYVMAYLIISICIEEKIYFGIICHIQLSQSEYFVKYFVLSLTGYSDSPQVDFIFEDVGEEALNYLQPPAFVK